MVENYNEQVFQDCLREIWLELSEKANSTRCRIPDGKGGFVVCRKDCHSCNKERAGRPDSLEAEEEKSGYEVLDSSADAYEIAELKIVLEGLFKKLRTLNPTYADIIEDLYKGCSQEEIAIKRDKSNGTIGGQVPLALALAKAILEEN